MKKKKKFRSKDDARFSLLALPTTICYLLFCYLPMFGVILAYKNYRISGGFIKGILHSEWAGIRNFAFLFGNRDIWVIIRNTLAYNAVMIILGLIIPIALALILYELRNKAAAKAYQIIFFFPYFLSWAVVSTLVWGFLCYDMGMINRLLGNMSLPMHRFYMEPSFWPGFLIFMSQWKGVGYGTVIYLAACATILIVNQIVKKIDPDSAMV